MAESKTAAVPDTKARPGSWEALFLDLRAFLVKYPEASFMHLVVHGMRLLQVADMTKDMKSKTLQVAMRHLVRTQHPAMEASLELLPTWINVVMSAAKQTARGRVYRAPRSHALRLNPQLAESPARFVGLQKTLEDLVASGMDFSVSEVLQTVMKDVASLIRGTGNATTTEQDVRAILATLKEIPALQRLGEGVKDKVISAIQAHAPVVFDILKGNLAEDFIGMLSDAEAAAHGVINTIGHFLPEGGQELAAETIKKCCGCVKRNTQETQAAISQLAPVIL